MAKVKVTVNGGGVEEGKYLLIIASLEQASVGSTGNIKGHIFLYLRTMILLLFADFRRPINQDQVRIGKERICFLVGQSRVSIVIELRSSRKGKKISGAPVS